MTKLLLIDVANLGYRCLYRPSNPFLLDGRNVSGVREFASDVIDLFTAHQPEYAAFALDTARARYERRKLFAGYKAGRDASPPDEGVMAQMTLVRQLCRESGVPVLSAEGWEADDVIATCVESFSKYGPTVIAARDKDYHQLVTRGVSIDEGERVVGVKEVEERWGVRASEIVEVQALSGDGADGVPGVEGIGPKRAAALVLKYGSAERAQRAWASQSPKVGEALRRFDASLGKRLVELNRRLPLSWNESPLTFEALRFRGFAEDLTPFLAKLGIGRATRFPETALPTSVPV